jgi:hypothetical protein
MVHVSLDANLMMGANPVAHENREDVPMKLLRTAKHLALTSAILSGLAFAAPAAAQNAPATAEEGVLFKGI